MERRENFPLSHRSFKNRQNKTVCPPMLQERRVAKGRACRKPDVKLQLSQMISFQNSTSKSHTAYSVNAKLEQKPEWEKNPAITCRSHDPSRVRNTVGMSADHCEPAACCDPRCCSCFGGCFRCDGLKKRNSSLFFCQAVTISLPLFLTSPSVCNFPLISPFAPPPLPFSHLFIASRFFAGLSTLLLPPLFHPSP